VIGKRREELRLQKAVPVLIEPVAVEPMEPPQPAVEPEPEPVQSEYEDEEQLAAQAIVEEQLDAFAPEPDIESVDEVPSTQAVAKKEEPRDEQWNEDDDDTPVDVLNLFGDQRDAAPGPLKPLRKFFTRKDSIVVAEPEPEPVDPQEVLVINVLSKEPGGFQGPDLLQLLLACDLRFGKKNIFHRYEKPNAKGAIQFSVANLVEPGTFDLDAMDNFSTPGVSFFLSLPGPEKPLTAFNYMVETAQVLVRHLHAELRDDAHSVMTAQTIEHCRQRIRDFERKQLTLQL